MKAQDTLAVENLSQYQLVNLETKASYSLESRAKEFVTHFEQVTPLSLLADNPLDTAIDVMRSAHVGAALVASEEGEFLGIVSLTDLQSVKVLSIANKKGLKRDELSVQDVMVDKSALLGLSEVTLAHTSIGEVLHTLEKLGSQHILVVNPQNREIKGLISARDIAKKLHIPVHIVPTATSFEEVMLAVQQSH